MWLRIIGIVYAVVAVGIFFGGLYEWRTTHHGIEPGEALAIGALWPLFLFMALLDGF